MLKLQNKCLEVGFKEVYMGKWLKTINGIQY